MKSITTFIILCAIKTVFVKHHHNHKHHHHSQFADILSTKDNIFTKTNGIIQQIMNKLFEDLDLPQQFVDGAKVKSLLTMLNNLNKMAEKNFELHYVLRDVTNVTVDNKAVSKIRLDEMVRTILSETQFYGSNIKNNKNETTIQTIRPTKKPLPGFNDSREFKEFIKGFLGKVKRLTVDDLFKKKSSAKKYTRRKNLEVWKPPSDLEMGWLANDTTTRRIYRGKKTGIHNFPFVASVHILDDFTCVGNIIARDLILTAASCVQIHYNNRFFRENPRTTFVRIGSEWTSRLGEIVPVAEIYFHPGYNPKTLKHNLAILRLERTINFQTQRRSKIKRIWLDRGLGNLPANTREIVILGWGAKKPNQLINAFEKLTVAFLDVFPIDECREIYSKEYVTETNFCAGFMSRGGGACNRDVGAPGVVGGVLAGVVSFGAPVCGASAAPTVYTRVGPYWEWIKPIIIDAPLRFGKPKTTKMTSKAFVYYFNTMTTRTYPHIKPIMPTLETPPQPLLRARDLPEEPEENILQEILIDGSHKNDTVVHEVIHQDLTDDFYDLINTTSTENNTEVDADGSRNKTIYLIPKTNIESSAQINTTIRSLEQRVLDAAEADEPVTDAIVRVNVTRNPLMYDEYEYEYETEPIEEKSAVDKYESAADSQESRQEYFDKIKSNDDVAAQTDDYQITQSFDAKPKYEGEDSGDVAFQP